MMIGFDEYADALIRNRKALQVSVKIDHEEVLKIVVCDLIKKRNSPTNKMRDDFDRVLRCYLTEDEFEKYVIRGEEIE